MVLFYVGNEKIVEKGDEKGTWQVWRKDDLPSLLLPTGRCRWGLTGSWEMLKIWKLCWEMACYYFEKWLVLGVEAEKLPRLWLLRDIKVSLPRLHVYNDQPCSILLGLLETVPSEISMNIYERVFAMNLLPTVSVYSTEKKNRGECKQVSTKRNCFRHCINAILHRASS